MWTEVFSGLGQRTEMVDTILKSSTHGLKYFLVKCCDLTNFPGKSRVTPLVQYNMLYSFSYAEESCTCLQLIVIFLHF